MLHGLTLGVASLDNFGDADQIADSARLTVKLLKKGMLKVYEKCPHGMITTQAEIVKPDLLSFIKG